MELITLLNLTDAEIDKYCDELVRRKDAYIGYDNDYKAFVGRIKDLNIEVIGYSERNAAKNLFSEYIEYRKGLNGYIPSEKEEG